MYILLLCCENFAFTDDDFGNKIESSKTMKKMFLFSVLLLFIITLLNVTVISVMYKLSALMLLPHRRFPPPTLVRRKVRWLRAASAVPRSATPLRCDATMLQGHPRESTPLWSPMLTTAIPLRRKVRWLRPARAVPRSAIAAAYDSTHLFPQTPSCKH